jgi:hypothetical protein
MIEKRGRRYRVRVWHESRILATRSFDRRGDAIAWEQEQKQLILMGDFVSPSAGRVSIAHLAESYLEVRKGQVSVRAWESDESALRVHILPAFGKRSTGSVNRLQVERFLADLAASRSVGTAARVRTTFRGLFDFAVRARVIRDSPAAAVRMPRPDAPSAGAEVQPFTLDELLALVEEHRELGGEPADVTLILGLTGLRFGELRGSGRDTRALPGTRGVQVAAAVRSYRQGHRTVHDKERPESRGPAAVARPSRRGHAPRIPGAG